MKPLKAIGFLSFVLMLGIGLKGFHVYVLETAQFHPRREPVVRPSQSEFEMLRDVSFANADGNLLQGWMVPSVNGAAVILAHGNAADRTQMLPEARILARHGYGVLLFDWPGHGESGGRVRWNEAERAALSAATDLLAGESGVDASRLGALGFSMGGALVAQVAARDPRLRAVILEATFADTEELTRTFFGRWGFLMQWPSLWADQHEGMNVKTMRPIEAMTALSPRPVFVIAGSADRVVPAWMSRRLYDAASEPKQFWIVPGAGHGRYHELGEEYGERLRSFFDAAFGLAH